VKTAEGVLECKAKGIFRKHDITPLAGDNVVVEGQSGDYVIAEILERKNSFGRPALANADNLILVVSSVDPSPNILVLDKLIAMSCKADIKPTIVLTKTDITKAAEFIGIYRRAGFSVIEIRRFKGIGLGKLTSMCKGKLSVFVGNSGAGKSTLLNDLCPDLMLETGETSKKLGRGKHVTRAVELYDFKDGLIADTPGFSALDFAGDINIKPDELALYFPDFAPYRDHCYFSGCSHTVEKDCAVLDALKRGKIEQSRHKSYCAMYKELGARS